MSTEQPTFADLLDEDERSFAATLGDGSTRTDAEVRIDWLLERIAKRNKQIERNKAVADARKAMVDDWLCAENLRLDNGISWLESEIRQLIPHSLAEFEREYGKKSRNLPHGVIGFRRQPDKVNVFDEEKALTWAKLMGLPIKVKESVSKTELKKALDAGAEPDGVEIIKGLDQFYVRSDVLESTAEKE